MYFARDADWVETCAIDQCKCGQKDSRVSFEHQQLPGEKQTDLHCICEDELLSRRNESRMRSNGDLFSWLQPGLLARKQEQAYQQMERHVSTIHAARQIEAFASWRRVRVAPCIKSHRSLVVD